MEATRAHLNGDLEGQSQCLSFKALKTEVVPSPFLVGYADVLQPHMQKAPAHHAAPPQWLMNWEVRNRSYHTRKLFSEISKVRGDGKSTVC
jgi:hypothetical protein